MNPAFVAASSEARHYDLLALVTVLFVWQALRLADAAPPRAPRAAVVLAVLAASGALTHYHFALVAVGAAMALTLRLRRTSRPGSRGDQGRRLALGFGAMAAGYVVALILHPRFLESFARQGRQASDFSSGDLPRRIDRSASALAEFFAESSRAQPRPTWSWSSPRRWRSPRPWERRGCAPERDNGRGARP